MARVRLQAVSKTFGCVCAIQEIDLDVSDGEFFSLLGPSGCGKTTTLRIIAGFEAPSSGRVLFGDTEVTSMPPQKRDVGMVFQNYALFSHMTVGGNVAFGLRARKVEKSAIPARVERALQLVDMQGYESRPITALSGGQQQRVALARALVIEPKILLLDEPLSNLDARLRVETREQIRALQRRLGITTFYVTHDQEEALAQSDRLAVLLDGRCAQIGAPRQMYNAPASRQVMAFLGKANFVPAAVHGQENGQLDVQISSEWSMRLPAPAAPVQEKVILGFRPHAVKLFPERPAQPSPGARVTDVIYTGAIDEIILEHRGVVMTAQRLNDRDTATVRPGDVVPFSVPAESVRVFPAE